MSFLDDMQSLVVVRCVVHSHEHAFVVRKACNAITVKLIKNLCKTYITNMHDELKVRRYLKRARYELRSALLHSRLSSRHYLGKITNALSSLSFVTK